MKLKEKAFLSKKNWINGIIKTKVDIVWSILKKKFKNKLKKLKAINPYKPCSDKLISFLLSLNPLMLKKNLPEKTDIREEMKKKMKISVILFSFNVYLILKKYYLL